MLLKRVPGTIDFFGVRYRTVVAAEMRFNSLRCGCAQWHRTQAAEIGSDIQMTKEELDNIRAWDKRCGDNEGTFFPVTLDRRRLLGYVDELRAELSALKKPVILR
jgi:hypothetical protein